MMDVNSILLTDSPINKNSGGGVVSLNLLEMLQEISDVKLILSGQHFKDSRYEGKIPAYCIKPEQFGYQDPFFQDYFAKALFEDTDPSSIELAMSYGCPWGNTLEKIRKNYFAKICCDLAPHDVSISREEHIKLTGNYPYPHLNNEFLFKKMYLQHLRLSDVVVVHSRISAYYIEKEAGLKEKPVIIPHGVYLPEKIQEIPEEFTPGYFGSLSCDKGTIYLLNAWISHPLAQKHKMLLGGTGSDIIDLKENKDKFISLGVIPDASVFYNQISVYVQPTVVEGFGLTGLEAMAYGRPVITTTATGVADLIQDGREGFILQIRDIKAIREKIQYFYDNPQEMQRMGINARKIAEKYSWSNIKELYKKEIEKLI